MLSYKSGFSKSKTRNQRKAAKLRQQRLIGLGLLMISALAYVVASTGTTVIDRDVTVLFLTVPLGFYLLFAKEIVII